MQSIWDGCAKAWLLVCLTSFDELDLSSLARHGWMINNVRHWSWTDNRGYICNYTYIYVKPEVDAHRRLPLLNFCSCERFSKLMICWWRSSSGSSTDLIECCIDSSCLMMSIVVLLERASTVSTAEHTWCCYRIQTKTHPNNSWLQWTVLSNSIQVHIHSYCIIQTDHWA